MSETQEIADSYQIAPGVFVLGSLASGVTVYNQQVRALNLAFALSDLGASGRHPMNRVAVIGGGIAGLTLTAAILSSSRDTESVTLFEKRWDLCPLQQGCDTRWLHPNNYDWPSVVSGNPNAGLPVLNWSAGRASDVAAVALSRFADCVADAEISSGRTLNMFLGTRDTLVDVEAKRIKWLGHRARRAGRHFALESEEHGERQFDCIVVAVGFGLERSIVGGDGSYWRNDSLGQPELEGRRLVYVVSGYGDGGIVEVCRLAIERFRQDLILEELFRGDLPAVENLLRNLTNGVGGRVAVNAKHLFETAALPLREKIRAATAELRGRLRKDTRVILHARSLEQIDMLFENNSSLLNRLLLYLLHSEGGFELKVGDIDTVIAEYGDGAKHIRRHGPDSIANLLPLFTDQAAASHALTSLKSRGDPSTEILWPVGFYPAVLPMET